MLSAPIVFVLYRLKQLDALPALSIVQCPVYCCRRIFCDLRNRSLTKKRFVIQTS